jgi:hypothetical protein
MNSRGALLRNRMEGFRGGFRGGMGSPGNSAANQARGSSGRGLAPSPLGNGSPTADSVD